MTKRFLDFVVTTLKLGILAFLPLRLCDLFENMARIDLSQIRHGVYVFVFLSGCWVAWRVYDGFFRRMDFVFDDSSR